MLGLQPRRYRFKKHLNCVPLGYKMEEAYKGKKPQVYINCFSRVRIGAATKRVLVKQGLVGVQNDYTVSKLHSHTNIRL